MHKLCFPGPKALSQFCLKYQFMHRFCFYVPSRVW